MQRRNLSNAMRYLVAVCALISAFGLVSCGGDDGETKNVIATVPMDGTTVRAVQNQPLTFSTGQGFGVNIGTGSFTLTFDTPNTFIVNPTGNVPFTGTVTYGSGGGACTFLAGGTTLSISTCNLVVNAQNVVVGGSQVGGTITLVLNNGSTTTASSDSVNTTVFINDDGELFVINSRTGALVDMGIKP